MITGQATQLIFAAGLGSFMSSGFSLCFRFQAMAWSTQACRSGFRSLSLTTATLLLDTDRSQGRDDAEPKLEARDPRPQKAGAPRGAKGRRDSAAGRGASLQRDLRCGGGTPTAAILAPRETAAAVDRVAPEQRWERLSGWSTE